MGCVFLAGCGFRVVPWVSQSYRVVYIAPVAAHTEHTQLSVRLQDALIRQCLASSGLTPVSKPGADLTLKTKLTVQDDQVVATDADGRTRRLQFAIRVDFVLTDRDGQVIWRLENYRFTEQYEISTTSERFRDEAVFVEDTALETIADLVVTGFSLTLTQGDRS